MARQKKYNEEEVIEKAMDLFWRNGYEATSVRMLEKEMGINQFSIYSSFGSKEGVFIESLKCYKRKIDRIVTKMKESSNGIDDIKQFYYDFIEFSKENTAKKGCLLTSTVNELGDSIEKDIKAEISDYVKYLKSIIIGKLEADSQKDKETIEKQANFLMISKQGLSIASKVFSRKELDDFIEITFSKL